MWFALTALVLAALLWRARGPRQRGKRPFTSIGHDYRENYSRRNLLRLLGVGAVAAVLVYSGADAAIDRWHSGRVRGRTSDRIAAFFHEFGERYWFATWALFLLIDAFWHSTPLTRWGRRSCEAMVVGLPSLWATQRLLGASRPSEGRGPDFRPFADDNSASGHTFIGAVPLLVAARMSNHVLPRSLAVALSPVTGWSRINDRAHYASQVVLGYGLAYTAVETVCERAAAAAEPPSAGPSAAA